jgi:RimJ/RimL family protein N-acetyltransferase
MPLDLPNLETERLILRVPSGADLDGWSALLEDEESARFIGGTESRRGAWRSMAIMAGSWLVNGFGMFSVIEKKSGKWIGRVGPWRPVDWPGTEVGWALIKDAWGQGYAHESSKAAIDWAFATLNWNEVIHIISPENYRSIALAQRLGATNRNYLRDDDDCFSLLRYQRGD